MKFWQNYKWYILGGIGLIGLGVGVAFLVNKLAKFNSKDPEVEDAELSKKFNIHLIPDGKNNYRSAQITLDQYPYFIKKYGIKNIVRMNGDGADAKHQSSFPETKKADEKAMCEKEGCNFYWFNAHEGYKEGQGYVGSLKNILPILAKGNTLIHCTHGADRTGYVVASHLQQTGKMTDKDELWKYTTQYNRWQNLMDKDDFFGSGYDKYADAFYPIDELKKSKWAN